MSLTPVDGPVGVIVLVGTTLVVTIDWADTPAAARSRERVLEERMLVMLSVFCVSATLCSS